MKLYLGDCLDVMRELPTHSVDLVLTDPPYGTTKCKWDTIIPLQEMWAELLRIIKPSSAMIFTASQPFTSVLISSNLKCFKHEWIWVKNRGSNFATLKYQPMKEHESILVFSEGTPKYRPIKEPRKGSGASRVKYAFNGSNTGKRDAIGNFKDTRVAHREEELRFPSSVQRFNTEVGYHPTQKPVTLMEYLIKTYSDPGDTVLDFAMGSGSTGVACKNTGRAFIGIEKDSKYLDIAKQRIED